MLHRFLAEIEAMKKRESCPQQCFTQGEALAPLADWISASIAQAEVASIKRCTRDRGHCWILPVRCIPSTCSNHQLRGNTAGLNNCTTSKEMYGFNMTSVSMSTSLFLKYRLVFVATDLVEEKQSSNVKIFLSHYDAISQSLEPWEKTFLQEENKWNRRFVWKEFEIWTTTADQPQAARTTWAKHCINNNCSSGTVCTFPTRNCRGNAETGQQSVDSHFAFELLLGRWGSSCVA